MGGTTQTQEKTTSQQTQPWAPAQGPLTGILAGINSRLPGAGSLSSDQEAALAGLRANSGAMAQFTPQATAVASTLLSGGGANATAPMINDAYNRYLAQTNQMASGEYNDPTTNPVLQKYLQVARDDATNSINGMWAAAGRPTTDNGAGIQALGRGITQAEAPILYDAYNQALSRQAAAAQGQFNAGTQTGGILAGLNQQGLANQQTGLGAARTAADFANSPYQRQLEIAAQAYGIPVQQLAQLAGIVTPIAGLGQTSTGTSTQTTSTPFNAASLLPLGLMGGSGGFSNSLIGSALGGLGSVFGSGGAGAAAGAGAEMAATEAIPYLAGSMMFSDERVKENKAEVGALFDGNPVYSYNYIGDPTTRIGLSAQDVEKTSPDAVTEIGGIKAVDYSKATEPSRQLGGLFSGYFDKSGSRSVAGNSSASGGGLLGGRFGPPSFADFINNNQNAILGYLAGALQGGNLGQSLGRGLQGWQQGQQTDERRQVPETTYRALTRAGVPDATARAAALNPDIMRAITPHYFQRPPTFGVIGQDEQGRRRYGFIDPFNRTVQPADGQGPQR